MFDIGFSELLLVFIIGLVVLGPQRLPVAVKTVAGWIRALRSLATTVQNELTQELKLQEFQDSLKKVEKASLTNLTPELKASMDEGFYELLYSLCPETRYNTCIKIINEGKFEYVPAKNY